MVFFRNDSEIKTKSLSTPDAFVRTDVPPALPGLHVMCVWGQPAGDDDVHTGGGVMRRSNADARLNIEVFKDGVDWRDSGVYDALPQRFALDSEETEFLLDDRNIEGKKIDTRDKEESVFSPSSQIDRRRKFRNLLSAMLGISKRTNEWGFLKFKQPFGVFDSKGTRLKTAGEAARAQLVLLVEGGQWMWPPIRKGYIRTLPQAHSGRDISLETVSVQPVVFRIRGFLTAQECDDIVEMGKPHMVYYIVIFSGMLYGFI